MCPPTPFDISLPLYRLVGLEVVMAGLAHMLQPNPKADPVVGRPRLPQVKLRWYITKAPGSHAALAQQPAVPWAVVAPSATRVDVSEVTQARDPPPGVKPVHALSRSPKPWVSTQAQVVPMP